MPIPQRGQILDPKIETKAVVWGWTWVSKLDWIMENIAGDDEEVITFTARNDVEYKSERSQHVVFIKRGAVIEADKPIRDQV